MAVLFTFAFKIRRVILS